MIQLLAACDAFRLLEDQAIAVKQRRVDLGMLLAELEARKKGRTRLHMTLILWCILKQPMLFRASFVNAAQASECNSKNKRSPSLHQVVHRTFSQSKTSLNIPTSKASEHPVHSTNAI